MSPAPCNARMAHKAGLVWVNVSLDAGKKAPVAKMKLVGAVSPQLAKAIEHLAFGDVDEAREVLRDLQRGGP